MNTIISVYKAVSVGKNVSVKGYGVCLWFTFTFPPSLVHWCPDIYHIFKIFNKQVIAWQLAIMDLQS